ncbi:hypothetical protein BD324DRAFT_649343 [Kockovaella imperatae]|uniref:Translation initiation factor 3 N-terminal domain-containing protein n=1 Tax=Kockovaella imperatae TaxID=4999 RepID=A0A1Y1UMI3_9TREE|nr:hypothetical protein BD324DRAFT_649343 [Kockovaella imperatae]ORX39260.1 hypothetical protein BD324DRAFT_649343 [Kockovaella imperatae]
MATARLIESALYLSYRRITPRIVGPRPVLPPPQAGPSTRSLRLRPFSSSSPRHDQPKDDEIPYSEVHTVNDDGRLNGLVPLHRIRAAVNLQTHHVVLVSEDPPVVKVIAKTDLQAFERRREADLKTAKKLQIQEKEVQISWSAADGDIQTKLSQAKNHLAKGDRVLLIFAPRQGSKKRALPERMEHIVGLFDKGLEDTAEKWKDDEFKGRVVTSHWQPLKTVAAALKNKVLEQEDNKARSKDEKKEQRKREARARQELAMKRRREEEEETRRVLEARQRELDEIAAKEREGQ